MLSKAVLAVPKVGGYLFSEAGWTDIQVFLTLYGAVFVDFVPTAWDSALAVTLV